MKHVIIGAGAAGIKAARTIRSISKTDEIVMISADTNVCSRCMLHKYIGGERSAQELSFVDENFFEDNHIKWLRGVSVKRINPYKKTVILPRESISYDRLLIATGANSVTPPIGELRGADNVFGLRHFSDAEAIKKAAHAAKKIVVIGAGLVGLDAAYALIELGKKVTVVEMDKHVLPLNLDVRGAKIYQEKFEEHGCTFKLGRRVNETVSEKGKVTGLVLNDGEHIPCDMVIVAAGVRPATELLMGSGIDYYISVKVNKHMQTSEPEVYAAGDATGLSGIWPNAVLQGEVAAKNMCGIEAVYDDTYAVKNTLNFFGVVSLSVGKTVPDEEDTVLVQKDANCYNKYIMNDGVVCGVILQGDISNSGFWQYLIKNKINVSNKSKPVWKLSYADFFDTSANGEYQWKTEAVMV